MVKFLIERPIAVTMTFIAILVLGVLSIAFIPVSMMPDIDIPEITVEVTVKNMPARELEDAVVKRLRRQLMQTTHLADIKSVTRDENSLIHLKFDYNTDIDFAFIEVNEKIDQAMGQLPREISRPKVIKASATDLPVFYLNLTLKDRTAAVDSTHERQNLYPVSQKFIELSRFASQVIRKRLEQLPEIAMVDMSGMAYSEILIMPDIPKLNALQLTLQDLEGAVKNSNIEIGNLLIQDGQYQYNVRFSSSIANIRDIENIYFKVEKRILQLKDVATVIEHPQKRRGVVTSDGREAISMAIIKQSDAQMMALKDKLKELTATLKADYPDIDFTVSKDQTKLLDYSISNLQQSLLWGALMAFLIIFFFLRDFKSPLLIGITIPASIVISLLFFYLADISINIISLSGLVLGVGMMIDNSIIVIDNISQYRDRGKPLSEACIVGTNEVFRPMLSSVFTTCAVFIPLIFISGIAGALFYDQAIAVTIGLFVSLTVSVTVLPVYYRLLYSNRPYQSAQNAKFFKWVNYEGVYEKGFKFTMRYQKMIWVVVVLLLAGSFWLYNEIDKTRLPSIEKMETVLQIDWNEKINVNENNKRVNQLLSLVKGDISQSMGMIGEQQFLLDKSNITSSEATLYLLANSPKALSNIQTGISDFLRQYPLANFKFEDAENIFDLIFADRQVPLTARLTATGAFGAQGNEILKKELENVQRQFTDLYIGQPTWQEHMVLKIDQVKMMTYDISFDALYGQLKSNFNEREVMLITSNQYFTPVILGERPRLISEVLSSTFVANREGIRYPVSDLVSEGKDISLKEIIAGQEGEYFPVNLEIDEDKAENVMQTVKSSLRTNNLFEASFTGAIFSNNALIKQLTIILFISLFLLYFILASQFESLSLPLIVLLEVPIDIFGAFLMLKLFGQSINLMTMIGIVVMSGIIINDSILKIDTVNQLRREGYPLLKALVVAGQRRLKPILMTSLTTILALVPLLFTSGMGSDLQVPLALTVIGGMALGTLVSLYFVPLCYYYLKR